MTAYFEIQIIAIIASIACSLPGVFLVLQKKSMMTDSITHTILLGIVLSFFIVKDLNSPFLIIGASVMGVITVWFTQILLDTKIVSEDSAIGIVFPFLFSIAIILISRYANSYHLDTDAVLLGEIVFAPFNRMVIFGIDIGPKSLYSCTIILIFNILFILLFLKELEIVTFDPLFALSIGISPIVFHYTLMFVVSVTSVATFEAVGSILVIAFMIGPANTAYLLTDNLKQMIGLSIFFAILSSVLGCKIAIILDVSIAGSVAVMIGIIFTIVFIFAPEKGVFSKMIKKSKYKKEFKEYIKLFNINKYK